MSMERNQNGKKFAVKKLFLAAKPPTPKKKTPQNTGLAIRFIPSFLILFH
jgi:hypothetical protein